LRDINSKFLRRGCDGGSPALHLLRLDRGNNILKEAVMETTLLFTYVGGNMSSIKQ
jgi:hypothetical protein